MDNISAFRNKLEEYKIKVNYEIDNLTEDRIEKIQKEFSKIDEKYSPAHLGKEKGRKLYSLIREEKPELMVETGVSNGLSTFIILKALEINDKGKLFSVDLPAIVGSEDISKDRTSAVIVPEKRPGWIVPEELKDRWELTIGNTFYETPKILEKIGTIDIFLHDSDHSYQGMMFEFSLAWEHLKDNGLLLADNIDFSNAFEDFKPVNNIKKYRLGKMGLIRK